MELRFGLAVVYIGLYPKAFDKDRTHLQNCTQDLVNDSWLDGFVIYDGYALNSKWGLGLYILCGHTAEGRSIMLLEKGTINVEELLTKAKKPSVDALKLHPFYRGKIETVLKCAVRDFSDFAIWYTPGVAAPCRAIAKNPDLVYEHTSKWNTVAVVSDGSRVLGLGDIGPKAGLPVMEGKALLYKYLGGVDGVPIMLDTKDPNAIIDTVLMLQPGFGGVNLEDISQPKCFRILDTLRQKAEIPIWHDDQQGTATVTLAGLMNALKVVGKRKDEIRIAFSDTPNGAMTIQLFNTMGQLLRQKTILSSLNGVESIWVSDLPRGTYLLKVETNGEILVDKAVLTR